MPEKKLVCPVDKREFKTRAALAQHRVDAHGAGPKTPKAPKQRAALSRSSTMAAPVAVASSVRATATESTRLSGVDRVHHGDLSNRTVAQSRFVELLITPGSFRRLAVVARAYQRIRYTKLQFRIEPQMSTSTSGGYVAAYVRDPADEVDTIDALTSQQGSVTTKWWQGSTVVVPPPGRLFYTSESKEIREYSPGKLVIWVDGAPSQQGSVTVFCEWAVELSGASLEDASQTTQTYDTKHAWYTRAGHQGFWWSKKTIPTAENSDWSSLKEDLITPVPNDGTYFKLTVPVRVTQDNGNVRTANWAYVYDSSTVLPCYWSATDRDTGNMKVDDLLLPAGTPLDKIEPVKEVGEARPPSLSDSQTTTAEWLPLLRALSELYEASRPSSSSSGTTLATLSTSSPGQKGPSGSMGK